MQKWETDGTLQQDGEDTVMQCWMHRANDNAKDKADKGRRAMPPSPTLSLELHIGHTFASALLCKMFFLYSSLKYTSENVQTWFPCDEGGGKPRQAGN